MSILNYFKKMLGFSTEKKSTESTQNQTQVVAETTCPVETIYEISPEPLQLVAEESSHKPKQKSKSKSAKKSVDTSVNQQVTDEVTQKKGSTKKSEQKTSKPKSVGEIKSKAK
jgi:hypothetical protein